MKCPKCLYIGFETGDRCKNCGYDFSLLALADDAVEPAPPELALRQVEAVYSGVALDFTPAPGDTWSGPVIDRFRDLPDAEGPAMTLAGPAIEDDREPASLVRSATPAEPVADGGAALPLFSPDGMDDEPLVKLPVSPRPTHTESRSHSSKPICVAMTRTA